MVTQPNSKQEWVLLSYRVPREPSTPRIAIWRRLKGHGVAQVGDGLVALPLNAHTKESLEWISAMVIEADGEAIVWVASTTKKQDRELAEGLNVDRDLEYTALLDEVAALDDGVAARTISRLRREWRRIERRDYFHASRRDEARLAVSGLVDEAQSVSPAST